MPGNSGKAKFILQERDCRLLKEIGEMRIIDREQSMLVANFGSITRANSRLLKLTRAGYLNRFFVGTIPGGRKSDYTLSARGAQAVGAVAAGISRRFSTTVLGDLFVEHQTQINEIYLTLKYRARPESATLLRWSTFRETLTAGSKLIPDGYLELDSPVGVRPAFLEVDLGHETLRIWQQKVRSYLHLAISGDFGRLFPQHQFRVLVVANSARRLEGIRKVVAKQTDKIFWLSNLETINRIGFWSPVWLRPRGDQMLTLI